MTLPSGSNSDNIRLIKLLKPANKKLAAAAKPTTKEPALTQNAIIVNSNNTTVEENDNAKLMAVNDAPTMPTKEAEELLECKVKCNVSLITWTQLVLVQLLNGDYHHHN